MASSSYSLVGEGISRDSSPFKEMAALITPTEQKSAKTIPCTHCHQLFSKLGNRNKHIRAIHGIEPDVTPVETREKGCLDCGLVFPSTSMYHRHRKEEHGSLHCPIAACSWRGSSHRGLGRHAAESHAGQGKNYEWKTNHFPNQQQFTLFIREMYENGHLWYIRNGSNSSIEERIEYRYCHREDRRGGEKKKPMKRKRKGKGKGKGEEKERPSRILGVERSEACCTSYMRVRWRRDGRVEADYCLDHLAHDTEVTSLPLLPEHKKEIMEMLQTEDDPEEVVRRLREKYAEKGGRLATLQEEDVREVMMEEVDPFGEMTPIKEEEGAEETEGPPPCISMELSPSPSCDETNPSSALLALLDEHNVREDSTITLGELVANAQSQSSGTGTKKKMPRFKLTDNGFVFRFDKNSVCGERQFWRCERKNECAARIHTDMKGTIVKRINYHTHPSQADPEQVCLPKKKIRITPSDHSMLLPQAPNPLQSPTLDSGVNEHEFSSMDNGGMNVLLDTFIKEEDILNESMVNNGEDAGYNGEETGDGPSEMPWMQMGTGMPEMSEDFYRVFHLTNKVYAIVKKEVEKNGLLTEEEKWADEEVARFLTDHRFTEFVSKLRRYTKTELRLLSVHECKEVLENVAEGVRMHHAMRSEWGERKLDGQDGQNGEEKRVSPVPTMRVYVTTAHEMNPVYKMISLPEGRRSVHSLREGLTRRGVLAENERTTICVHEGPLTVELCDEMMHEWPDNRVFTYRRSGEYLVLEPSQSI